MRKNQFSIFGKSIFLLLVGSFLCLNFLFGQSKTLLSPNKNLEVRIEIDTAFSFSVFKDKEIVLPEGVIGMDFEEDPLKYDLKESRSKSVEKVIQREVPVKNRTLSDRYNELRLFFKDFSITFRAYDEGIAYRFETNKKSPVRLRDEKLILSFPEKAAAWAALNTPWMNDYQNLYKKRSLSSMDPEKTIQLPVLLDLGERGKLLMTESDLKDYPGLYFTATKSGRLEAVFPPKVKRDSLISGKKRIQESETYLADTDGERTFPWRIFAFADRDIDLLENEMVYKLAEPSMIKDPDWIKPGQITWDWWNQMNLTGVDFRTGMNTETYLYYVDFAAENGIPYVMIDGGWSPQDDILHPIKEMDIKKIAEYGEKKGVGIWLWTKWWALDARMEEAMSLFEKWDIKGLKIDHMDRDDQAAVNFYWRCARAAADHHLMLNFHGTHKPVGLERTFPHVLNFEGFLGLEEVKFNADKATPKMAVTLPYTRMVAGPMDYTPGAMRNAQPKDFAAVRNNPMSMGTRCQQLALYVVYDAPLQFLADNPTAYRKEQESLDFITQVPTTWDRTIPLSGKVGEYIALAREKEDEYFVGALTNEEARDLEIDFSFLPEGNFEAVIFQDGINADRNGTDYKKSIRKVDREDTLSVHLAPGGGWTAWIYRK